MGRKIQAQLTNNIGALSELGMAELLVASDQEPECALALAAGAADVLVGARYRLDAGRATALVASLRR